MSDRIANRRGLLAAIVVIALWGLITHASYAGTGDEPHYMMIAYSLAFDHDLDLTNNYGDPQNRALNGLIPEAHVRPGKDGHSRSVHDVGLPLLFTPYYAIAYEATATIVDHAPPAWLRRARLTFPVTLRHVLSLAMIAITAWMSVGVLSIFDDMSASANRALAWAALLVLSPPILSFSFLFFTELLSAAIALAVFRWIRGAPSGFAAALLAGSATGYLWLLHTRNAGLVAALIAIAVITIIRVRGRPRGLVLLAGFLAGTAVLLLARTAVIYHLWGTWLTTPLARFESTALHPFLQESATRLAGWLFDQEHGLLTYAPIYLLAPIGWISLWRADRPLCLEISVIVAAYVGLMTMPMLNAQGWRGGWTPAARFLVPVAPFLAILVFAAIARMRRVPASVHVLAAVQIAIDVIVWRKPGLLWNDGTGTSALLAYVDGGSRRLTSIAPSLISPIGSPTLATIGLAMAAWALVTFYATRRDRRFESA